MLKHSLIGIAVLFSAAAMAEPVALPPPVRGAVTVVPISSPRTVSASEMQLEPTEADLIKARQARAKMHPKAQVYVAEKGTKIETYNNQFNHMTHVRVTPHETEIPYVMKNKANRPPESGTTTNSRTTLGTPQFVNITW